MTGKYVPSLKKNIVLIRLFLSILGISTIAVIVVSTAIFILFRSKTIEDIETSDRLALTNIQISLDNVIDTTEKTIIETYKNPAIKRLIYENTGEWNDTMIATVNNTLSTLSTYSFLNSIYIFRESDILYKASNKGIPEEREAKLSAILDHENPGTPVPWTFRSHSGKATHLLTIFIGERSNATNGYESAIIGNIDMDMIHKAIFKEAMDKDQEIFVVNKNGTILLHNDMEEYDKSAAGMETIRKIIGSDKAGNLTVKENGKKYNVGFVYSNKGNYYIVHKIEYGLSVAKLTEARNTTLIYGILALLFVMVASLYMSFRIYRPINTIFSNIRGLFVHVPQATASSDELQAMANATAKIIEHMNNYDKHVENKAAIELIHMSKAQINPGEVEEILQRMKFPLRAGSEYVVIVLRVSNYKVFEENNTVQAIEYQLQSIGNIASDCLAGHAACSSYRIDNEHAVLLATGSAEGVPLQDLNVKKRMETASDAIFRVLGLEVTIGISGFSAEKDGFPERYKEAYRLTNYRVTLGKRSVIDGDMIRTETKNDELAYQYTATIDAAKKGSEADFEKALDRVISICARLPYESMIRIFTELAMDVSNIPKEIGSKNAEDKGMDFRECYAQFEKFEELSETKSKFEDLFRETSAILFEMNNTNVRGIVSKAVQYIAEHYSDSELSANFMADKLSITPSYFSKIFKECTNSTFPEHIANLRLEKAREMLLRNPDLDILEIGMNVGYHNASYFTAAFKKKYGITPSKLRVHFLPLKE